MAVDNRKDFLLLFLYSPGPGGEACEPIVGRTRLVKLLFIFKKEALKHFKRDVRITEENFYNFFPWKFGPFSSQVYDDLNFFLLNGFIEAVDTRIESSEEEEEWSYWVDLTEEKAASQNSTDYAEEAYRLTRKGENFATKLWSSLSGNQQEIIRQMKVKLANVPLRSILSYVYSRYPEMAEKSTIADRVLGKDR